MTHTKQFNLLNSLHTEEVEEDEAHAFNRAIEIEGKKQLLMTSWKNIRNISSTTGSESNEKISLKK